MTTTRRMRRGTLISEVSLEGWLKNNQESIDRPGNLAKSSTLEIGAVLVHGVEDKR